MLDSLLQGRAWIPVVGVLLAGIVFFNVDLLRINRDIARTSDRAAALKRVNAGLRTDIARLTATERVQRAAVAAGLVLPGPAEVRYLRAHPAADPARALRLVTAPRATRTPAPAPAVTQPQAQAPAAQAPATTAPTTPQATVPTQ